MMHFAVKDKKKKKQFHENVKTLTEIKLSNITGVIAVR